MLNEERSKLIFTAIGTASMCWEHVEDAGYFDSMEAIKVGEKLLLDLAELDQRYRDGDEFVVSTTDEIFGVSIGERPLVNIHSSSKCVGRACVIHNPSDHHMRDWKLHWRADTGLMERIDPDTGIGHPDPDDLAWHVQSGREYLGLHACDGACSP